MATTANSRLGRAEPRRARNKFRPIAMINYNEIQKELHENELARRKLDHERRRKEQEYADIRQSLLAKVRALQADLRREEAEASQRMEALLAKADRQRQEHNKLQLRTERLLTRQRRQTAKSAAKAATDSFISLYDKIYRPVTAAEADVRWRGFDQPYRGPAAMTDAAANSYGGLFAPNLSGGAAGGSNLLFEPPSGALRFGSVFDATRGPLGDILQTPTFDSTLRFSTGAGHSGYAFDEHTFQGGASAADGVRSQGWLHQEGNTPSTGSQLYRDETNSNTLNAIPSSSGYRVHFGDGISHQNTNRQSQGENDIGLRPSRDASDEPYQAPIIVTRGPTMEAQARTSSTATQDGTQSRTGAQSGNSLSAHEHQISMGRDNSSIIKSQEQFGGQHIEDEVNFVAREIDDSNKPKPGNRSNIRGMGMSGNISDDDSSIESESKHFPETRKLSHTITPSAKSSQPARNTAPSVEPGGKRELTGPSQPNWSPPRTAVGRDDANDTVSDAVTPQTTGAASRNPPAAAQRQSTGVKTNPQQKEQPLAKAQSRQPPPNSDQIKKEHPEAARRNPAPAIKSNTQEKQQPKTGAQSSQASTAQSSQASTAQSSQASTAQSSQASTAQSSQASTSKSEPGRATVTTKDNKPPQPAKGTLPSASAGGSKATAPSPKKETYKLQSDSDDDFGLSSKAGGLSFSGFGGGDRPPLTHARAGLERSASNSSVDSVEAMIQAAQTNVGEAAGRGESSGDHSQAKAAQKDGAGSQVTKPSTDAATLVKKPGTQSTADVGSSKPQPPTAAPIKSEAAKSVPAAPTTQGAAPTAKSLAPSTGSAMYSGSLARSSAVTDEDTNSESADDLSAGRAGDDDDDEDFYG